MKPVKLKYSNTSILPNSFITEQAVLNILLNNSSFVKTILNKLKAPAFYFEPHRIIYETLIELSNNNNNISVINLISRLQDKDLLVSIGGVDRIIKILNRWENFSNLDEYISNLNDKYFRRLLIELGKQIIAWGYTTSTNIEEIIEKIENSIFNLTEEKKKTKFYSAAEIVEDIYLEMKSKKEKNFNSGFETSFKDLDSIIQGFQKTDLIVIAGRPSMGKTALSLNIGKNIVERYDIPLIIFSLEMSRQQIIYRLISTEGKINNNRLKNGKMTPLEWKKLGDSLKHISELPIFIDDNPDLKLIDIHSKLKNVLHEKKGNGVVIIDYLQLMKLNFKLENRVQEISHITRSLKTMAKEFEIPFIVLSQLSRSLESRVNKRPMLSDLRESGCLKPLKIKNNYTFLSWKESSIFSNQIKNLFFKGLKPTYEIVFANNKKINLTANHKILSPEGWLKVSELVLEKEVYSIHKEKNSFSFQKEKIIHIYYQGLFSVYDQTVPIYHNYLEQNFLLHNSIEQDADIVIMVYREDYYNEKKINPQITELIVAKHRNGSVGTAKVLFDSSITEFSNL